jgi:oligopeptide transport system substrate-binding protein
MIKRLLLAILIAMTGTMLTSCAASRTTTQEDNALTEAEERIAALEVQLEEAQAARDESALADLESRLAAAQEVIDAAQAESEEAKLARCTFGAYRLGWAMDWPDAGNIVDTVFGPTSLFNYTFWSMDAPDLAADFQSLAEDAYSNPSLTSRSANWQAAERIVVEEEVAVIPIFHHGEYGLVSTDLTTTFPPFGGSRVAEWSYNNGRIALRWASPDDPSTLDPQLVGEILAARHSNQLMDTLYRFTEDGNVAPLAATDFTVSPDGRVYTIHLREDAVWSDGVPVTAQHFVDGITRLLSPDTGAASASVMFVIDGAKEFNTGERSSLDSVVALDDYTLEITLTEPVPHFDSLLASTTLPVRLDIIEAYGDDWLLPGNYVGNGAYVLTEYRIGEITIYEKNDLYWDSENVQIERIEFPVIPESQTALIAFERGEIDVMTYPQPEEIATRVDTPEFTRMPRPGTSYLGLNTLGEHTGHLNFRRALASAIDRQVLVESVLQTPWQIPATGIIPPEIIGYQGDAVGYPYDPEAAQDYLDAYLTEAGIEVASDIVIELWDYRYTAGQLATEAIESMWEETLGIDVRTVDMEFQTYIEVLEGCYGAVMGD